MVKQDFLNQAEKLFSNKFTYDMNSYVDDNTEMKISFHDVSFLMKPKLHLKSETGFPRVVDFDLFYVMAEDALKDEFGDYEFIEESYQTYGVPMTIKYKGTEYRRIPSRIVNYFSRHTSEYEEYKEIASHYKNYEDMSAEHPLVFPKIRERLWFELLEHFDIYHKDYADIECIKKRIAEYKEAGKSVEEFIIDEPRMYIALKLSNNSDLLYDTLKHDYIIKEPKNIKVKNEKDRCIYAYEFNIDNKNYVYVGLTNDRTKRDREHRSLSDSAVYRFAKRRHVDIPEMKIIIDYEKQDIARNDEGLVLQNYIDMGYIKINEARTGSLGGTTTEIEYTKEDCIKILKNNNITFRTQWLHLHRSSYLWAKKHNLLDELLPKQLQHNYSFEECLEDASKYKSGKEWMRCSKSVYRYARRQHWLTDITHMLRESTCLAMCSLFDKNVIYYVFSKVSEVEQIFGFREDGVIRAMTGERDNYMNFAWKRISYNDYEHMKYINDSITKEQILYISKKSEELRFTLKKIKPIFVFENDKRDVPITAYKTSYDAMNSPYLKYKKNNNKFAGIINRCSKGKPLDIANGYFWRYGTWDEYYDFHKEEINYLNNFGTVFPNQT